MATPIGLAAMGGVLSERSGVLNIGLEGMMLTGALAGAMGSYFLGGPWLGTLAALAGGAVLGIVLAYLTVTLGANQIVTGVGINLFALGFTTFIERVVLRPAGIETVPSFAKLAAPGLRTIPLLGPLFADLTPLVLVAIVIAPILAVFLYRTPWGLALRATGEVPRAADTAGISVFLVRYMAVAAGGALAGMGGAFLSLGQLNLFSENMTAGRGFIALAAVILGKWNPVGALAAAFLFGAAEALQLFVQSYGLGVPYQIPTMLPYVLALAVLAGFVSRAIPPAAEGIPYQQEEQ
jgi:simple sugar transport system permease protein